MYFALGRNQKDPCVKAYCCLHPQLPERFPFVVFFDHELNVIPYNRMKRLSFHKICSYRNRLMLSSSHKDLA